MANLCSLSLEVKDSDKIIWKLDQSGVFSVKSFCRNYESFQHLQHSVGCGTLLCLLKSRFKKLRKFIWEALFFATSWKIWLKRNDICFNGAKFGWMLVVEDVLITVAIWARDAFGNTHFSIPEFIFNISVIRNLKIKKMSFIQA